MVKRASGQRRGRRVERSPVEPGTLRLHWKLLLLLVAVWVVTTDDRHVGIIADGRQMIWTAVAMSETGGIGQARGRDFTWQRPSGDSVSRYGMGMSLAQLPAAAIAPAIEEKLGRGSSQPLFLIAPLLCNLVAALAAASAVRHLGGAIPAQRVALLLTGIGSPLASYAALEFSEPLQAATLAVALAASVAAVAASSQRSATRLCVAAGFAAGLALLTKSSLLFVAPLTLLPLAQAKSLSPVRRLGALTIGFVPPAALWLAFEIVRFGRPFGGYGGERFSHPFLDGLWRLTVGVNKGVFWYFPAVLIAALFAWRSIRRRERGEVLAAGAIFLPFLALLGLAAAWWAWHGAEGWGPRLLVPAIPLLAVGAALGSARWPAAARRALVSGSILLNVLPLVQHPTPIATYTNICTWPVAGETVASRLPAYARLSLPPAPTRVSPDTVLTTLPQASPFIVYPWFIRATWARTEEAFVTALRTPPWIGARSDIRPELDPLPAALVLSRRHGRFWGRGFFPSEEEASYAAVYDEGLMDQVVRAQQMLALNEALRLALRLERIAPSGDSVALLLESYRLLRLEAEAKVFLASVPASRRADSKINLVLALFERRSGNEESARRFLESAAAGLPGSPAARAVNLPMAEWPPSLSAMTSSTVEVVADR